MDKKLIDEAMDMFFAITVVCASIGISMETSSKIIKAFASQSMINAIGMMKFLEMESIPYYEANKGKLMDLATKAISFITPFLTSKDLEDMLASMEKDIKKRKEEEAEEEHPLIKKANEIIRGEE
jgi:hypothetical protein